MENPTADDRSRPHGDNSLTMKIITVYYKANIPRGLVARIPRFHRGGPGSIPGVGTLFTFFSSRRLLELIDPTRGLWLLNQLAQN